MSAVTATADKRTRQKYISRRAQFDGDIVGPDQVADMLVVCRKTVINMANAEKLPYFRAGSQYRFSKKKIEKFMESGVISA